MDIWVLNKNYDTLTIVDIFDSIVWTTRYNDVCEAEIVTYPFSNVLDNISIGCYLTQKNSDRYMMVEDMEIVGDAEQGDTVTLRIEDLSSMLKWRIINVYTELKMGFADAVNKLLQDYFINPSDSSRRIPGFVFNKPTDSRLNFKIENVFHGETVFDAIKIMCQKHGVGFKVVPHDVGGFEFKLYLGVDRSYNQAAVPSVIFSETFENLVNSRYQESTKDKKNVLYIGGEGEDADQFVTMITNESSMPSGMQRREMWTEVSASRRTDEEDADGNPIDLTDAEYAKLLAEKGAPELEDYKAIRIFDGKIEAERQFVLGEDFFIGDIVQVVNKWGYESTCRIVEIVETEDSSEGHTYYPTFSSLETNV